VANGKPAKIYDTAMEYRYVDTNLSNKGGPQLGTDTFKDLTDLNKDEFVYVS
jgi:hypothetical protein